MDISINGNKYAKQENVINMANVIGDELEKINKRLSGLEPMQEATEARLDCLEKILQQRYDEVQDIVLVFKVILKELCTPLQAKKIKDDIAMIEKIQATSRKKQDDALKTFDKELTQLREKYGIKNNPS